MLTLLEVRTSQGNLLTLPLDNIDTGFPVELIDGLDPVKATLVSSNFASMDGAQYQTSRRESRNIKIRLNLEPDFTFQVVRDLRQSLYKFFMPKSEVYLRFYLTSGLVVEITGRVESFETPLFTQEPAVDISIVCFNPDFHELAPVVLTKNTTSSEIESVIPYVGSVETGIKFSMRVNRVLSEFTIYHRTPDNIFRTLDFAMPMLIGDVIDISTVRGNKYAKLTRAGTETSALWAVSDQSSWLELLEGDNYFRVFAVGLAIPYTVEYVTKYGGL